MGLECRQDYRMYETRVLFLKESVIIYNSYDARSFSRVSVVNMRDFVSFQRRYPVHRAHPVPALAVHPLFALIAFLVLDEETSTRY